MSKLQDLYERQHLRLTAAWLIINPRFPAPVRKRRYLERSTPHERWRSDKGMLAISLAAVHLRHVGNVVPGMERGHSYLWQPDDDLNGWYTNLDGDSWKDGGGLVWGVVLQLPARGRHAQFLAGWQQGGWDDTVVIDLSRIFSERQGWISNSSADLDACKDAARHADKLAEDIADSCRDEEQEHRDEEAKAEAEAEAKALLIEE